MFKYILLSNQSNLTLQLFLNKYNINRLYKNALSPLYDWSQLYLYRYNELSRKTRFQSVPIAALCLYTNSVKTWFLKILSVSEAKMVFPKA